MFLIVADSSFLNGVLHLVVRTLLCLLHDVAASASLITQSTWNGVHFEKLTTLLLTWKFDSVFTIPYQLCVPVTVHRERSVKKEYQHDVPI